MKRILTLDGGGVHGLFALCVLERLEAELRHRNRAPDLVLGDHFDLISGTSTGAIIAACLAWGFPVSKIKSFYLEYASDIFRHASIWRRYRHRYRRGGIADRLQDWFTEPDGTAATMESTQLRSFLMVVVRNGTTGSPWPICNNPAAPYNDKGKANCNLQLPIWQLVRASTAAPTFFPAETIRLGADTFEFIDGGVSSFNNPAWITYLHATLPYYGMCWQKGTDRLSMISVGTGSVRPNAMTRSFQDMNIVDHVRNVVGSIIYSSSVQQDVSCRLVAHTLHGHAIDRELGDMRDLNSAATGAFSYVRWDRLYDANDLERARKHTKRRFDLDNLELIPFILEEGERYAQSHVLPELVV